MDGIITDELDGRVNMYLYKLLHHYHELISKKSIKKNVLLFQFQTVQHRPKRRAMKSFFLDCRIFWLQEKVLLFHLSPTFQIFMDTDTIHIFQPFRVHQNFLTTLKLVGPQRRNKKRAFRKVKSFFIVTHRFLIVNCQVSVTA